MLPGRNPFPTLGSLIHTNRRETNSLPDISLFFMFVSPCRWWAQWRQGLSLALPPVLSQTAWDPWKWFCNLHGYSSPSRESQIEEAGNSGLGFGDALRWGGSEGRQLDTCILRVSFFLLAGNMTHVRQVSDGHVRITELVLEKNEPPPKKKNWENC